MDLFPKSFGFYKVFGYSLHKEGSAAMNNGKSTLMEVYQEYLRQHNVANRQIIVVNLEDYDFYELRHLLYRERISACI